MTDPATPASNGGVAEAFARQRIAELSEMAAEDSPDREMRQFALGAVVAFSEDLLAALKREAPDA